MARCAVLVWLVISSMGKFLVMSSRFTVQCWASSCVRALMISSIRVRCR